MSVVMHYERVEEAKNDAALRVVQACEFFVATQQQRVSIPFTGFGASKPGEYPHLRTAQGKKGITTDAVSVAAVRANGLIGRIGQRTNSWYMLYLENFKDRLGFLKTFTDLKALLKAIIEGGAP